MPKYIVTAPDGKDYEIEGEGSQEEALEYFKSQWQQPQSAASDPESPTYGQAPTDPSLYDQGDVAKNQMLQSVRENIRQAGRGFTALADGVQALPRMALNAGIGGLNAMGANISPIESLQGSVPEFAPKNDKEVLLDQIHGGLGGALTSQGIGSAMAGSANTVTQGIGQTLMSRPAVQAAGAVTGAAGSEVARRSGGGEVAQLIGGLGGGMLPGFVGSGAPMLTRAGFRGGEAGRQQAEDNLRVFEKAGTTPSVGQATENRLMRGMESLMSRTPGGAGQMARKADAQAEELGDAIESRAATLAKKTSGEQAGRKIEQSVRGEDGFVARFKAKQNSLYDELDKHVSKDTRVSVDSTRAALAALNAEIDGARNVSQLFINSRIKGIENALKADLKQPTDEAKALATAQGEVSALEQSRAAAVQESGKFQAFGNSQKVLADQFTPVKGMPRFPGRYSDHPARAAEGEAAAAEAMQVAKQRLSSLDAMKAKVAELEQAAASVDGKLPFEAIKKLRTLVGNEISDSTIASDVPRSKWKALYGALSEDMGEAVKGSDKGREAWTRANNYTKAGLKRIEAIESVIDKSGGPEAIFRAATSNTRDGASTLRAVMQSLDSEGQKTVSATMLRRLGIANPSNQNDLGEKFSTQTFLTNWNKLSPEAKRTLFDRYGAGFREDMDQIAKITGNLREGSKVFQNPSGTEQATAQAATVGGFALSLLTGQVGAAATIAAGVGGANLMSRLMVNPRFVRWLAQSTKHPLAHAPSMINGLANTSADDPDIAEAVRVLKTGPTSQGLAQ